MTATTAQSQKIKPIFKDENVLVVRRTHLFSEGSWQGLKQKSFDHYLKIIQMHKEFLPRISMETNHSYKQIIPYLVFEYGTNYFLMQRKSGASETRLAHKYSLGIGGHIRKEDMTTGGIFDWAKREFHEEVQYEGEVKITPLGILNDDSSEVGKVHMGFVFLLRGNSSDIRVKSELKHGALVSLATCRKYQDRMETWSQLVVKFLTEK